MWTSAGGTPTSTWRSRWPARLLDKPRVEHARSLLARSALPAKTLAAQRGSGNPARMKRAFERELGIGPRQSRVLHARAAR